MIAAAEPEAKTSRTGEGRSPGYGGRSAGSENRPGLQRDIVANGKTGRVSAADLHHREQKNLVARRSHRVARRGRWTRSRSSESPGPGGQIPQKCEIGPIGAQPFFGLAVSLPGTLQKPLYRRGFFIFGARKIVLDDRTTRLRRTHHARSSAAHSTSTAPRTQRP